jgi:hypothetical protein
MSRLWKSIIFVALIVGVTIVALVVIQPWENGSGGVTSATPRPTRQATVGPTLTTNEVCAVAIEKCTRCRGNCSAGWDKALERWSISCQGIEFSYREATKIVAPENQAAQRCLGTQPTPVAWPTRRP